MEDNFSFIMILYIVDVILYIISFAWIIMCNKLECGCLSETKINMIRGYLVFLSVLVLLSGIQSFAPPLINSVIMSPYVKYFVMLSQLIYIVVVFVFLQDIIRKRCECNNYNKLIYNNMDLGIIVFFLVVLVYTTILKFIF
jgi:hypothetical protein